MTRRPVTQEEAAEAMRHLTQARTVLTAAVNNFWPAVLGYETTVGIPDEYSRKALEHAALALRALELPVTTEVAA